MPEKNFFVINYQMIVSAFKRKFITRRFNKCIEIQCFNSLTSEMLHIRVLFGFLKNGKKIRLCRNLFDIFFVKY